MANRDHGQRLGVTFKEPIPINVEIETDVGETQSPAKRGRPLSSEVWSNFTIVCVRTDGKKDCKCNFCSRIITYDSKKGNGNLKKHTTACVKRDTRDIGQLLLSQCGNEMRLSSKFEHATFREKLVSLVIRHDLPFRFLEYKAFRSLLLYLRPDVQNITRNTCRSDVLSMYKREKVMVKTMLLDLPGRVSLTSDCWTSITTDGYVSLTAHYVDENWKLQKRILNFSFMPPPHSGVSLCEKIHACLIEWGIEKKIFCITLDNASANDVFVDILRDRLLLKSALVCDGEYLHVRCCAHIVNLIVHDGLKEIDKSIEKIRDSIKYVKSSQSRKQRFFELVNQNGVQEKKGLRQDVSTRWNSTYIMLESACYYERGFASLRLVDSNYIHCPTTDEWKKVKKICGFLEVFYTFTLKVSAVKNPTSNLFFPLVYEIYLTIVKEMQGNCAFLQVMSERMFLKFNKYWKDFSDIMAIACILDPRYKYDFVRFAFGKIYEKDGVEQCSRLKKKLYLLFGEYSSSSKCGSNSSSSVTSEIITNESPRGWAQECMLFVPQGVNNEKSELDLYLEEPRVDLMVELDVMEFWRANSVRYPSLGLMSRDVLSIPISTVASESAFSSGGRVLDQYRSCLKHDVVEALMCTKDWMFGNEVSLEEDETVKEYKESTLVGKD